MQTASSDKKFNFGKVVEYTMYFFILTRTSETPDNRLPEENGILETKIIFTSRRHKRKRAQFNCKLTNPYHRHINTPPKINRK